MAAAWSVGERVKALDTVGIWCTARILRVDTEQNAVFVHYLGWSK